MQAFKSVKVANFHYKLCGWFRLQKSFCTGRKAYFPELTSFHLQKNKFVVKWFLSILVQYKWNWTFCKARILIRNDSMLSCLPSTEKLERSLVVDYKMSYCWSNDAAFKSLIKYAQYLNSTSTGLAFVWLALPEFYQNVPVTRSTPYSFPAQLALLWILLCLTSDDFTRQWGTP